MFKQLSFALILILFMVPAFAQKSGLKVIDTFHIASAGGWDYLAVNYNKLYVSHGTQVNILNKKTGDSVGVIANTTGVHGIAFANQFRKGYTSNGRLNNITVFDVNNDTVIGQIATGQNPDAILYEPFSKKVFTCNGKSNDLSVIDPATGKLIETIAVGGRPEEAASDENGKLFVNIEDKNEVVEISTRTFKVEQRWSIAPGEGPTGLAYDKVSRRLFSACDNKLLIVLNADNGKVVAKLPIGDGCDGDVFDSATKNIYTSNGEGTLTVIHQNSADNYAVIENIPTKPRARTISLDYSTHRLYLPTADFEKPAPGAAKNERPKMIRGTFQVLVMGE